jgi:type I restriction enzyme, S subunit
MSFPRYPAYKDSGVEWLGEVPEHWTLAPLKILLDIQNGSDYKAVQAEQGYPVIGSGGAFAFASQYHYDGESVLLGRKGTIDRPLYVKDRFWAVDTMYWSKIREGAHGKFTFYVSQCIPFQYYSTNTALPSMTKTLLGGHIIAVPSLTEQVAIAAFLDRETAKIDALIAEQHRLIELLQEKRQAVISHAVTKGLNPNAPMKESGVEWLGEVPEHWEVGPVKRFLSSMNYKRIPLSAEERATRQGEYPYYGASGIIDSVDEYLFEESLVLVSEDGANLLMRSTPIAFVASGKYWVNNHAHILKPNDEMPTFWSERIESLQIAPFVTGSAQPKLTAEALINLTVAAPPKKDEKNAIEQRIQGAKAEFDPLLGASRKAIALLQERRSALISAAVTGQIDVRGLVEVEGREK